MLERAYQSKKTKEDRITALESVRPLCIQCQRPVGTLFMQKKNHKLYAKCGDTNNPCDLKIILFTGKYAKINTELDNAAKDLENSRELIIRHKMDTIFKYMSETESTEKFKLLLDNYDNVKYYHNQYLALYNATYFNEVRKQAIAEKMQTIYDLETEMNQIVADGDLHNAMSKYIESYMPENQNLRELKYEIMETISDINENTSYFDTKLYQSEVRLNRLAHILDEEPHVIAFVYNTIPVHKEPDTNEIFRSSTKKISPPKSIPQGDDMQIEEVEKDEYDEEEVENIPS